MNTEQAELIAIKGLSYIAADETLLTALMDATGLAPADLLTRAGEAEILGGVLDFLLADEKRLLAFCETADLRPESPVTARKALPGGEEVHWT